MHKYILKKYISLIEDFLNNSINIEKFEEYYLKMVKEENYHFGDEIFEIIQTMFSDLDEYRPNEIYDPTNPDHINEEGIRVSARRTLTKLNDILNK